MGVVVEVVVLCTFTPISVCLLVSFGLAEGFQPNKNSATGIW